MRLWRNMLDITIRTILDKNQRYNTSGDYFRSGETDNIRVSKMGKWQYEMLIAIHELVELALIRNAGIKIKDIDAFDIQFEEERKMGIHGQTEEPGDAPDAPYRNQHEIATIVEKIVCSAMGISWQDYDRCVTFGGKPKERRKS